MAEKAYSTPTDKEEVDDSDNSYYADDKFVYDDIAEDPSSDDPE